MSAGRIVLWRHGRTAYNASARLQGQIDIPLDEIGEWQVATAAQALADRYTPARIVVSDLSRARATAAALAALVDAPLTIDARVRERAFGDWEGLTSGEIAERWPQEHTAWAAGGEPNRTGAETRAQVLARVVEAVTEHAAPLGPHDTLVVVSHGAAISLGVIGLIGLTADWRGISGLTNAHWAELHAGRAAGGPAWRLEGLNLGPTHASSDWNAGPDAVPDDLEDEVRDPA
ncbi:histidine phosphatase family protein [Cellulomonas hominis]